MKYFGVTEGGDAGLDFNWVRIMESSAWGKYDGAVIITKCLSDKMTAPLLRFRNQIILHVTVTGYAGTVVEPNTPAMQSVLHCARSLLDRGFPKSHVVLRIDPVIPTKIGLKRANKVFRQFCDISDRVRVSVLDMYQGVAARFEKAGLQNPYAGSFQASDEQFAAVDAMLAEWKKMRPEVEIEACAEEKLHNAVHRGCISDTDYEILGLQAPLPVPSQTKQRKDCNCCITKKEMLGIRCRCPNQCLYCYWRDGIPDASEILLK